MKNIHKFFKKYWPAMVIVLFSLWAIKPLFVHGFFPIHDDEQVGRLFEMNKVIFQGQIPPRWVPDLGFGFGYPLFNFYPPFVYYLGTIIHILGFSIINATKIVMGLGFLLSGFFMYLWAKNRLGVHAGLFAAFLYIYVPYHAVDLYVRGALSEFFSFVFIPALFWSLDRLVKAPTKGSIALSSILLCFIILTHTLVMLQLVTFLLLYMGYLLFENRKLWKKILPSFFGVGLLGIGLSAYFAIPSFFEKKYTLVDTILTKELANYAIHFVCPAQFWNSPWGYGGSIAGCIDGLSFQVGKVNVLLVAGAFLLVILGLLLNKFKKQYGFALFTGFLFLFSLFMATDYSKWVWDTIQPFSYIQFPWRFLLFAGLFSSFLGGFVISKIQEMTHWKIALVVAVILGIGVFYQVRNDFKPQKYLALDDNHFTEGNDILWRVSGLSYEYVPKQVATKTSSLGTTELAISEADIPTSAFSVIKGQMHITVTKNTASQKNAQVTAATPGLLQVNTYSFPGWIVLLDGKEAKFQDKNRLHLLQIPIQPGNHTLSVMFTNTPIRTISTIISIISMLFAALLIFFRRRSIL